MTEAAEPPIEETIPFGRRSFRSAVGWSYVTDGVGQLITTGMSLLLAAILGPEKFGVVALALLYVLFIELIQRQGMGAAVIQRRDLQRAHADAAFWTVVSTSVALTAISILLSGWWADVNDAPELRSVVIALSFLLPIQALVTVQDGMLRRDMNFRVLAIRRNVAALLGGALGVGAALAGWGVWALVVQQLATALTDVVTLWLASTWRPRFQFSFRHARDLLGYSTGVLLSSLAVFVTDRSDALMTGIFFGPVAVGLYRFGGRMVEQLLTFTSRPLPAAALPELARHQDERAHFAERVDLIARVASLASVPLLGVLAGVAYPFADLLGDEWSGAAPALQLLCVVGVFRSLVMLNGPVLHALGRAHLTAAIAWVTAGVSAGAFLVAGVVLDGRGTRTEVVGMALSRVAVFGLLIPVFTLPLLARFAGLRPMRIVATVAPGWVAGIAAWGAGGVVDAVLPGGLAPVIRLGAAGVAAVMSACAVLLVTDRKVREFAGSIAGRVAARRRGGSSGPETTSVVSEVGHASSA